METLLLLLLTGAIALYVGYPYFAQEGDHFQLENGEVGVPLNLTETRDVALETLKDIQLDHEMGKLSDQDYQSLNSQYRSQVLQLLKEIKSYQAGKWKKVLKPGKVTDRSGEEVSPAQAKYCSYCGVELPPWGKFCHQCGHEVFRGNG